jgi:hypothetical protein
LVWCSSLVIAWSLRRRWPVQALYAWVSILIMLGQGEFSVTFRYVGVLFVLLYFLSDWVSARGPLARVLFLLALVGLNAQTTWKYASGGWAY